MSRHEIGGVGVKPDPTGPPRQSKPPWMLPLRSSRFGPSKGIIEKIVIIALFAVTIGLRSHWASHHNAYWDHNGRGNDAYARGDWADAISEYSQMIEINPNKMDGYSLRGMAYDKMGQFRLAARDYRTAITLCVPDNILWQNLGYSDDNSGEHTKAIADFTEAIRLDPTIPDTPDATADADDGTSDSHKGRLWAYYAAHQYALALQDCDALIARHPYPSNLAVRGKINREAGNFTQAKADFDAAITRDPHLVKAYAWEEEMLEKRGLMAASLALAREAVKNNPTTVIPLGSLGFTEYTAGQYPQAIATDEQVLARDGSQTWVRFNLGLVYAAQGDWEKSQAAYQEALRRGTTDDKAGALVDVRNALAKQPRSAALHSALMLLTGQKPPTTSVVSS